MQPGGPGTWTVVINRSKPAKKRIIGTAVFISGFLLLALAICALVDSFDDHTDVSELSTSPGIPIVSTLSGVSQVRAEETKPIVVVQAHLVSKPPTSSKSSLASMEREVIELEKQIQLHMSTRAGSLEKALKTTAACASDDNDCNDAHQQIKWKASQDKYEQGAMQAILQKDNAKRNSSKAGAALFEQYAAHADRLSGLRSLSALNEESSKLVKLHSIAERESLNDLRQEEDRLNLLRMEERREQDAKQAEIQNNVITKTESHMAVELARMNGVACGPTGCDSAEDAATGAPGMVPVTEQAYRKDFAQAESIEELRRRAFLANELAMHEKVLKERQARAQASSPVRDAGTVLPDAGSIWGGAASAEYRSDVERAMGVEAARQAAQRAEIEVQRKETALARAAAAKAAEAAKADDEKGVAAAKNILRARPDEGDAGGGDSDVDDGKSSAEDADSDEEGGDDADAADAGPEPPIPSGGEETSATVVEQRYRRDVAEARRASVARESRAAARAAAERAAERAADQAAQARANQEAASALARAGSANQSPTAGMPADYGDVSPAGYEASVAQATAAARAHSAAERTARAAFLVSREESLQVDAKAAGGLEAARDAEVAKILASGK